MSKYEIRKITNEETLKEVQVSGITLSLKIIWKDGVTL